MKRPNTWSALGVVAHGVVEGAARGLLAEVTTKTVARERVEALWNELTTKAHHDLEAAWRPMCPPLPMDWPGYHLTRTRVIRRCLRRWERNAEAPQRFVSDLQVERTLSDPTSGIAGRPDRVEGPPGDRCVVDLKTGLQQEGPTQTQRRQLLMYAHLVAATSGELPARIAIEDASGRRWEETITSGEIIDAIAEVREAFERYSASVAHGPLKVLAMPGAETCGRCGFKPVCGPYWQNLETAWEHGSVAGIVADVHSASSGSLLEIAAQSPVDATSTWFVSSGPVEGLEAGSAIAVTEAEITEAPQQLRFRWFTNLTHF